MCTVTQAVLGRLRAPAWGFERHTITAVTDVAQGTRPAIVLVSAEHCERLADEFGRYARDYDLVTARSADDAMAATMRVVRRGGEIAMFVAESRLPDMHAMVGISMLRSAMPTARRVIVAEWANFREDSVALRPGLAKGKFDAFLLMPRGARDEEFHTALCELLSEWGATVPVPLVDSVQIVSDDSGGLTLALRDYLDRVGSPNRLHSPDSEVGRQLIAAYDGEPVFPLLRLYNGNDVFAPTSVRDIASLLYGRPADIDVETVVELVVIGGGPAGLATAVYGASEGLSTVLIESEAIGGQAGTSSMIRNYLGFPRGISGGKLAQRARSQALRFGTRFFTGWPVNSIRPGGPGDPHTVCTDGGEVRARAIVIATGVDYRRIGIPTIDEMVGRGVNYGAAMTAAREMEDQPVFVVGGGNSAGQAAVHLARFARSVTILIRRPDLSATMSRYLIDEIDHNPRITVRGNAAVVDGGGEEVLEWISIEDTRTREREQVAARGLFLLLGAEPHCEFLPEQVRMDEHGFVLTGREVPMNLWVDNCPPEALATSVPGIFAVGDIRSGSMKRVASAAGEGASVIPLVHRFLEAPTD